MTLYHAHVKFIVMRKATAESDMTLVDHLDELRTRLIIALVSIGVCSVGGWFLGPYVLDFLISHVGEVQYLSPTDAFKVRLKIAFLIGTMIASPIVLTEIWLFVAPGLYSKEKKFTFPALLSSFLLFFGGGAFGTLILPLTLDFLEKFSSDSMYANYSIDRFISFSGTFIFAFAIVFQIPIVLILLAKLGVVSYASLSANRKYAFLTGLVIGSILTPADPVSMFFLSAPLYLLFEISLIVIRFMKLDAKE